MILNVEVSSFGDPRTKIKYIAAYSTVVVVAAFVFLFSPFDPASKSVFFTHFNRPNCRDIVAVRGLRQTI